MARDTSGGRQLSFLRATVLESLRLWPTTPMILRQTTREVEWDAGTMPANCGVLIFTPYFHRDGRRLPGADRFDPALWLDPHGQEPGRGEPGGQEDWAVVPFSAGPVRCPGRHLVLLLTSALLGHPAERHGFHRPEQPSTRPAAAPARNAGQLLAPVHRQAADGHRRGRPAVVLVVLQGTPGPAPTADGAGPGMPTPCGACPESFPLPFPWC
ncbi:cytochrome P450 [Arthrobacter sp. BHU FT2]|nr:cytochrome P450 [Arthrobacter sp. BHU FT2]